MNAFHTERRTGPVTHPFEERVPEADRREPVEDASLKAARADAVEFVVKAFAAVDKNVALADKARSQQEKSLAATERLRAEAENERAGARRMREEAERELAETRTRCEAIIVEARAKGDQLLREARARCKEELDSARRELASTLLPIRELVGQAGSTIDALVEKNTVQEPAADETIDVRDNGARDTQNARLYALVSPVLAD